MVIKMPKIISISILPDVRLIPAVLEPVRLIAQHFKCAEQAALALEEAIGNIIEYCDSDRLEEITVDVSVENAAFIIAVTDKGTPGDLDAVLKGEQKLGLQLMRGMMDRVVIENLGDGGRRQVMSKIIEELPNYSRRERPELEPCDPDIRLTIRPIREEEIYEVARCIYDEFGLSYATVEVYYPERFAAEIRNGDIYSLVAVTDDGEVAAHLAISRWKSLPGIWEMCMGVVKHRFRNVHIMGKMAQTIRDYAQNELKLNVLLCEPVLHHPFTQKISNKFGFHACGVGLLHMPVSVSYTINYTGCGRSSVAVAMAIFRDNKNKIYVPDELKPLILDILGRMELSREFMDASLPPKSEKSEMTSVIKPTYGIGRINVFCIGKDFAAALRHEVTDVRRKGAVVIELFIIANSPGVGMAYAEAKRYGFFCTGLIPLADAGDMIMLESLFEQTTNYDSFVTVEPFTAMINSIHALDPGEAAE